MPKKPAAPKAKKVTARDPRAADDKPILYAKAGGPPANWRDLKIVRVSNGREIPHVYEADAYNGWVEVAVLGDEPGAKPKADGQGRIRTRRLQVPIRIERR